MNAGSRFMVFFALSMLLIAADAIALFLVPMPLWLFLVILALAIALCFVPLVGFKGAQASVEDGSIILSAPFVDLRIPLSSIDAVECRSDLDPGLRICGYGGIKSGSGTFSNKEFGSYTFAGNTAIAQFVIVRYGGGKVVAFNVEDASTTFEMYSAIKGATGAEGGVSTPEMSAKGESSHRNSRRALVGGIVLCIILAVAVVAIALAAGHADVSMDDDGIAIDATMMDRHIGYDEIAGAELRYDVDYGMRVGGYGGTDISSGNFRNDEFGRYQLAIHHDVGSCIVLHLKNGDVVVFNLPTDEATKEFSDRLSERLSTSVPS